MSIKIRSLCIYFVLFYLFVASGVPSTILFLLMLVGNICYLYVYFKNLGSAWIATIISYSIISTSLFLSTDLTGYMGLRLDSYILFLLEFIIYVFFLCIFYLINKKYHILHFLVNLKRVQYFSLAAYTLVNLLIDYMLNCFINREDPFFFYIDCNFVILSISLLFYVVYNICLAYRFNRILSYIQSFSQKENYYKELDGFRHDFKSLLFSLSATIEDKDISATKAILDGMKDYSTNIVDYDQLLNINNKMLVGLLKELKNEAAKKSVSLKIVIPETIDFFNINTFDFIRLLSIIINNAIEESEEKNEEVCLTISKENDTYTKIICKNKVKQNKIIDSNKLLKKNYTTKNNHEGLGLWNFKKISSQYKNLAYKFTFDKVKQEFIVTIKIFN